YLQLLKHNQSTLFLPFFAPLFHLIPAKTHSISAFSSLSRLSALSDSRFLFPFSPPFLSSPLPNGVTLPPFLKVILKKSHFFTEKTYFFEAKNQIFLHLLSQRAKLLSHWAEIK
ncbi:hypothetical protein IJ707_02680, partial [bacterium]|nr:hypothetical protein [bacterium]